MLDVQSERERSEERGVARGRRKGKQGKARRRSKKLGQARGWSKKRRNGEGSKVRGGGMLRAFFGVHVTECTSNESSSDRMERVLQGGCAEARGLGTMDSCCCEGACSGQEGRGAGRAVEEAGREAKGQRGRHRKGVQRTVLSLPFFFSSSGLSGSRVGHPRALHRARVSFSAQSKETSPRARRALTVSRMVSLVGLGTMARSSRSLLASKTLFSTAVPSSSGNPASG